MKVLQKGFTLIELMIVIAIIGILATLALPTYQSYIARSQAAEGLKVVSGLQAEIAIFLSSKNKLPNTDDISKTSSLSGKYFSSGKVSVSKGIINIEFDKGANKGEIMRLRPNIAAKTNQISQWECDGFSIQHHLPKPCRKR